MEGTCRFPPTASASNESDPFEFVIQRTCTGADKILGLGGCPPDVLEIGDEWGGHDLNMGLFFCLKTPTPK